MDFDLPLIESFRVLKMIKESEEINMKSVDFITPFLIAPISAYITKNNLPTILPSDTGPSSYLTFISFPRGISVSEFKGLDKCKNNFPLFCFSDDDITRGEVLEKLTHCLDQLTGIVKHKNLIYQPLDELIDNTREHAFSDVC